MDERERTSATEFPIVEKTIYTLTLHESLMLPSGMSVMRVDGGWLYDVWDIEEGKSKPGTFVPDNRTLYKIDNIDELIDKAGG